MLIYHIFLVLNSDIVVIYPSTVNQCQLSSSVVQHEPCLDLLLSYPATESMLWMVQ